ncbi:MAG TPA: hypothetical protein DCF99_04460 [Flavobacteriaceae bacterium]|nr:hypothetical protein [Flavobacteriaceae bacterium]
MVKLQLPVPKYLKKILDIKYGPDYVLKDSTILALAISNTLMRKHYAVHRYRVNSKNGKYYRFKELSEVYIIQLSIKSGRRKGFEIDENKIHKIVRAIDKSIREELYTAAIINKEQYDIEYQTTILNFLDQYDIEEDELSYESLRKDFNRLREKLVKNLKNIT